MESARKALTGKQAAVAAASAQLEDAGTERAALSEQEQSAQQAVQGEHHPPAFTVPGRA